MEQRRLSSTVFAVSTTWPQAAIGRLRWVDRLWESPAKLAASAFLLISVAVLTAINQHPIPGVSPSPTLQAIRAVAPMAVAIVAVLCVYRPWPAFLAVIGLTPIWNVSQTSLQIGPVQVILQTVFASALIAGCAWQYATSRHRRQLLEVLASKSQSKVVHHHRVAVRGLSHRYVAYKFVAVAAVAFVGLSIASTLASPDLERSATVLLHGIVEPIALGAVLVWLRPGRRDLMLIAGALGIAIALGTALNLVQAAFQYKSLSEILSHRLVFAYATYNNVGNFAIVAAMTVPLLAAVVLGRRQMRISDPMMLVLGVALALTMTGLFFSLSKSAWLSATVGLILLLLLVLKTWRRRFAVLAGVATISAVFIPWPGLVLQGAPPVNAAYRAAAVAIVGQARFDSWNPATLAGHGSMVERYYAVEGGVQMAVDHPLFGVGPNEFRRYYLSLGYRPKTAKDMLDHAHSILPEVAAELGIPAVMMLLIIVGGAMWAMIRAYRSAREHATRVLAAAILASILAWMMAATAFGCDIYRAARDQSSDVVAAAIVLAMAVALARLIRSENTPPNGWHSSAV